MLIKCSRISIIREYIFFYKMCKNFCFERIYIFLQTAVFRWKYKKNFLLSVPNRSTSRYYGIWTYTHLVWKRTLEHSAILAKWLSVVYELTGYEFQSSCSYLKQLMLHLKKIITKTYINTYSQQCYVKFLKSLEQ